MLRRIILLIVLIGAISAAVIRTFPPAALPADAPANEFSAERAIGTIRAIAQDPRIPGSPAYDKAAGYLLGQMADLGLTTDRQTTTVEGVKVDNLVGRLEGTSSANAILLMAHLDSVPGSPGATDDASGVAAVLEAVRALRSGPPIGNSIIILFTGPEENCCYGARAFVQQHAWARDVRLVINLDAGGLSGPSILAATGPQAGGLIREIARALPHPIGSSAVEALGSPKTDYTLELRNDGYTGFDFNLSWNKGIHSPLDDVNHVDLASLQHQGEHMLAVVRRFGDLPLEPVPEPRPIYFDLLGLVLVHYPASWAIPITGVVTIAAGFVFYQGFRRKHLSFRGLSLGALILPLSMLTVLLFLYLVQLVLVPTSQSAGQPPSKLIAGLAGNSPLSYILRWGSAVLALGATYLWSSLLKRIKDMGEGDRVMGATLFLYLVAVGTSVAFPALSYLFVWPLLFNLILAVFWFPPGAKSRPGAKWLPLAGALGSALIATLLFVPGILIALLSIDIQAIYFVPVFVVAWLGFLIPAAEICFAGSGIKGLNPR